MTEEIETGEKRWAKIRYGFTTQHNTTKDTPGSIHPSDPTDRPTDRPGQTKGRQSTKTTVDGDADDAFVVVTVSLSLHCSDESH